MGVDDVSQIDAGLLGFLDVEYLKPVFKNAIELQGRNLKRIDRLTSVNGPGKGIDDLYW